MTTRLATTTAAVLFALATAGSAHAAGDPVKGKAVFAQCAACHKADPSGKAMIGPNLWGVVGRMAGSAPAFAYSPAMKGVRKPWTEAALDAYIAAPAKAVPGNRMPFAGLASKPDRANLIAYLKTLK